MNKIDKDLAIHKFKRSMYGAILGDVYGSVFEFKEPKKIPKYKSIHQIKENHKYNVFDHEFGYFTDDTILMLCAMQSFIDCERFSFESQMERMGDYIDDGKWARDGFCFDIGASTVAEYNFFKQGYIKEKQHNQGGNGVLMKLAPYAFYSLFNITDNQKETYYKAVLSLTHGAIALESTIKLGMLLERIYAGEEITISDMGEFKLSDDNFTPNGFCNGSYNIALRAYKQHLIGFDIDEILMKVISLGYDTDTNACISGMLIGYDDFDYKYRKEINELIGEFCEVTTKYTTKYTTRNGIL